MAFGSLIIAPLGDIFGRRWIVLSSLALMAAGSLMSAGAESFAALASWRAITGVGIGACVAVINPLSAEFANRRWRPLTVSMMAMGYPVGGLIGGLAGAILLKSIGWSAIFLGGFGIAVVLFPVVAWLLPESPAFLIERPRADRLQRVNSLLARLGHPTVDALPPRVGRGQRGYTKLFGPGQRESTLQLTLANLLYATAVFYIFSWLPQMVADAGFPPATASLCAAVMESVGVVGGLTLGWLARGLRLRRLSAAAMIAFGLSAIGFGYTPPYLSFLISAAGLMGFFLFAGVSGLYATIAMSFGAEARATGAGFVIGVGRIASAIGPLLAGGLYAAGFQRAGVSVAFGGCAVLAGLILTSRLPSRGADADSNRAL